MSFSSFVWNWESRASQMLKEPLKIREEFSSEIMCTAFEWGNFVFGIEYDFMKWDSG